MDLDHCFKVKMVFILNTIKMHTVHFEESSLFERLPQLSKKYINILYQIMQKITTQSTEYMDGNLRFEFASF